LSCASFTSFPVYPYPQLLRAFFRTSAYHSDSPWSRTSEQFHWHPYPDTIVLSQPAATTPATREALLRWYISLFSRPTTIESIFPIPFHIPPEKPKFSPYALPAFVSRGHTTWLHLHLDFQS
jgi:hypothetical protein